MILIQRRIHGGHLALAESIVERGVDLRRGKAETRSRIAIDHHGRLQTAVLLVAVDVDDDGNFFKCSRRWAPSTSARPDPGLAG